MASEEEVYVTPRKLASGEKATVHYKGELKDRDALKIRYGFNGWNVPPDGRNDFQSEYTGGNNNFYRELRMDKVSNEYLANIDIPRWARAVHFVFHDDGHWDNNDMWDYSKSITFPYIGPYLTWSDEVDPTTGVNVSFETSEHCNVKVEYGKTERLENQPIEEVGRTHHIPLTSLTPGTQYYYRIADEFGQESDMYTFRTAQLSTTTCRFIVLADMQDNGDDRRWQDVAEAIGKERRGAFDFADFALIAGDMPWNDKPGHWWTFFDNGRSIFPEMVIMPAVGNHDTPGVGSAADTSSFQRYFRVPMANGPGDSSSYYRFRYGQSHFIALNSENSKDLSKNGEQYRFVEDELQAMAASQDRPQWVFTFWHKPPYNCVDYHRHEQYDYRPITELFDGDVDWVFCGHVHSYQRMNPLRFEGQIQQKYGRREGEGVGYMVVPPAGNRPESDFFFFAENDEQKERYRERLAFPYRSPIGFVRVDVQGKAIAIEAYGIDAKNDAAVIDRCSYKKE